MDVYDILLLDVAQNLGFRLEDFDFDVGQVQLQAVFQLNSTRDSSQADLINQLGVGWGLRLTGKTSFQIVAVRG